MPSIGGFVLQGMQVGNLIRRVAYGARRAAQYLRILGTTAKTLAKLGLGSGSISHIPLLHYQTLHNWESDKPEAAARTELRAIANHARSLRSVRQQSYSQI